LSGKLGDFQFSRNTPYLLNIYAEDMLIRLQAGGWKVQELYGYADDHLILSGTPTQLRRAIEVVEAWSLEYNIKLNPQKSGILEVPSKFKILCLRLEAFLGIFR